MRVLDSGIEIIKKGETEPILFCSFQDRNLAFQRIKALWRMASPHSANVEMSDDEKTEDEEEDGGNFLSDKSSQSSPFTARFAARDTQKESIKLKDIIQGQNSVLQKMVRFMKINLLEF